MIGCEGEMTSEEWVVAKGESQRFAAAMNVQMRMCKCMHIRKILGAKKHAPNRIRWNSAYYHQP